MKTAVLEGAIESGWVYAPGTLWANTETLYGGCACTPGFNTVPGLTAFWAKTTHGAPKSSKNTAAKSARAKDFLMVLTW